MNRHHRIPAFLVLAIFLLASVSFAAETYQAKVIGISDGDTIKVLYEGTQVKIRLYGIDTPEKRQAFGNRAKQFTSEKVFVKTVTVIPVDKDRYGRTVALIQSPDDPVTLNEALVQQGFAWVYRKYCKADFCPDWLTYGQTAQAVGRGLWSDPDPIPPWQYRKK